VDAIDAYALLWSARRARAGEAVALSGAGEADARGLRREMIA
jgi:hypothetical protein